MFLINLLTKCHIPGQWQPQSPSVEVVPDNNMSLSPNILTQTMDLPLRWRQVNTCCRVVCVYCAYVTIRLALGDTCFASRHFVNIVSVQHFSAKTNKKQQNFIFNICRCTLVTPYGRSNQNLPSRWVKCRVNADGNLIGNYITLRNHWAVKLVGLPSTRP